MVKQDYVGRHAGWFAVNLAIPDATITSIMWCSDLFAPQEGEVLRDISDCHAHNLLKTQLYPGNYCEITDRIRINPESVSGFWLEKRQADLVIHAIIDNETMLEQIVRVNPLHSISGGEEKYVQESAKPKIPTTSSTKLETHTALQFIEPPNFTVIITAASGALCLVLTVAIIIVRHQLKRAAPQEGLYEFVHVETEDEEEERRLENLNIVLQAGKGASSDFKDNYGIK